jgi:hypothetical protein
LASFAVIIPAVGYFGTVFSLVLNPRLEPYDVLSLALDHSIPWLAVYGVVALGLTALVTWLILLRDTAQLVSAKQDGDGPRWKRLLSTWALILVLLLILLFGNFLAVISVLLLVAFPISFLERRLKSGPFSFRRLLSPLLVFSLASTLLVAALAQNLDTGSMRFSKSAGIQNGYYSIVGNQGNQIILLPCNGDKGLISVNGESLLSVKYSSLNTSLFEYGLVRIIRTGSWQLPGAQTHCPA